MPRRLPHPCPVSGCTSLTLERRCAAHKPQRHWGDRRSGARTRGYDAAWERLRSYHLVQEPLCRRCGEVGQVTPAELVDHVTPIDEAPERRLDSSNLQSLCRLCHGVKTAQDKRRGREPMR